MRRIISILLENEPGALSRVVGLFSQRGYNIETLNVAPTEDATLSRLTLTTAGDDKTIEQITKNLNKLVDVVKLVDLTEGVRLMSSVIGCDPEKVTVGMRVEAAWEPLSDGRHLLMFEPDQGERT